jgi:hypothetical protein
MSWDDNEHEENESENSHELADADVDDEGDQLTEPCPHCRKPIYDDAEQCPYCHHYIAPEASYSRKPLWLIIGALVALAAMFSWWKW